LADKDFKVKSGLDLGTPLPLTEGGTGQTSANNALNALLPLQTSSANKVLQTDGTSTSWVTLPNGFTKGDTAARPGSPSLGDIYSNTETGYIEVYTSAGWSQLGVIPTSATSAVATDVGTSRAFNNGAASIAFTAGSGGGLVSSFTAASTSGGYSASGSSSPIVVTGIPSNTSLTFTVTATNGYGNALASAASNSITATTVPQAPTIGTALVPAVTQAIDVVYTAGATGGKAVSAYTATSSPGGFTGTGASPIRVSGLTNGTAYTFTVTATNANGTSSASAASNSVTPRIPGPTSVDYLIVAGGASGGGTGTRSGVAARFPGGGGGAGGFRTATGLSVTAGTSYTVTIGAGGAGVANVAGNNGSNSSFNAVVSTGGGGGAGYSSLTGATAINGNSGGSGGGGSDGARGTGTAGQGNDGGGGAGNTNFGGSGGGGGGASASGVDAGANAGAGGSGTANSYSGSSVTYAGGGGGGQTRSGQIPGSGGAGGGGAGAGDAASVAGIANTGGGGGGGGGIDTARNSANGGSGVVIIRYPNTAADAVSTTGSPTFTNTGGNKIYTFTSSGSITF